MRIAIISDVHLGYGTGTELAGDPSEAMGEAIEKSLGCDIILLGGDIFDSRTPSTETLTRCMEILIRPMTAENMTSLVRGIGKGVEKLTPLHMQGIPVVAIHGTHERRTKGLLNPLQALEKAGFIIHLHANGVVLEKGGEHVCIQGMSGVPEQFSETVLKRWNPKPERGCFNVLMLHQSVSPFMYAEHLLPLESIPTGFDLYVLGHIHESKKSEHAGSTLLIPGSMIPTKLTKEETSPRGFWILDTKSGDAAFIALESQRRVYCIEHQGAQNELESDIEKLLSHTHKKKPLIRVKGSGLDVQGLKARFGNRSLFSVRQPVDEEPQEAVGIQELSLSVKELGKRLLSKNLESAGLDIEAFSGIFDLLENGKPDEALRLLSPERQHKPMVSGS